MLTPSRTSSNGRRRVCPHQALGDKTPDVAYQTGVGGGALIVDKFPRAVEEPPVPLRSTGDSSTAKARSEARTTAEATAEATAETKAKTKPGQRRPAASAIKCAA